MYKTGDLGRWLPEGNIEFSAQRPPGQDPRLSHRAREIEARLASFPGVREASCWPARPARRQAPGGLPVGLDAEAPVQALREHLGASLPEYMVPAAYVSLEACR